MYDDVKPDAWAMSDPVVSRSDIGRKFGHITYFKGASVLRMLEGALRKSTFIKGLSAYLKDRQFSNAVEEQLFDNIEKVANKTHDWPQEGVTTIAETFKTWTNQAGFPLVQADWDEGKNGLKGLTLTQSW